MKFEHRILEENINGISVFIPQFFNRYTGWKIFKCFATDPDKWLNYTRMGLERVKFKTLKEAIEWVNPEYSLKIHEINN
jgi:hypothetical protein